MRTLWRIFVAGLLVASVAIIGGCKGDHEPIDPTLDPNKTYFHFEVSNITSSSADVAITASEELPVNWLYGVYEYNGTIDSLAARDIDDLLNLEWLHLVEMLGISTQEFPYDYYVDSKIHAPGVRITDNIIYLQPKQSYLLWACPVGWRNNAIGYPEYCLFKTADIEFSRALCVYRGDFYNNGSTNFYLEFDRAPKGEAGNVYCLDLEAPAGATEPIGRYIVGATNGYKLLAGEKVNIEEINYLIGSHYGYVNEEGYFDRFYLINRGEVVVTSSDDGYNVEVNCGATDENYVRFSYNGPLEFIDAAE